MSKFLTALALVVTLVLGVNHWVFATKGSVVEMANERWNTLFNSSDITELSKLYTQDATLSAGNGGILKGRDAIKGLFQSFIDNGVNNHNIKMIETYETTNQIVQIGKWSADGLNENKEKISFGGVLMTVLIMQNDKWVIKSHVWNMSN